MLPGRPLLLLVGVGWLAQEMATVTSSTETDNNITAGSTRSRLRLSGSPT